MALSEIAAAIDRGDHAGALRAATTLWRRHRDPALAALIERLGDREAPAIAGRDKTAYQRAWLAAAREPGPAHDTSLAAGLTRSVPIRETSYLARERDRKRYTFFLDRIAALAERDADPRIARALYELVEKAPYSVDDCAAVYGPVLDLLVAIGDPRTVGRLQALLDQPQAKRLTMRQYLATELPARIARLARTKTKPLPESERAIAAELLGAPTPIVSRSSKDLDALLAECLANPDDDAPRLVYADALLERDDPRGEFIQLQLRAAAGEPVDDKRMASLQRKHEKAWLGDLARITKLRVFRRGFLDEVELLQGAAADPATWKRLAMDPRLATLRVLHKGHASEELYGSFVCSPALTSLRDLEVPSNKLLRRLSALDRPIHGVTLRAGLTKEALETLGSIAKARGIRRLTFETWTAPSKLVDQLAAWPDRAHFDEIVALPYYRTLEEWVADDLVWLLAFDRLAPVSRIGFGDNHNRLVLTRTKRGFEAEIVANQEWLIVRLLSRRLPRALVKLTVRGRPASWFPPGPKFARLIAKLPAGVLELREAWAPFLPRKR